MAEILHHLLMYENPVNNGIFAISSGARTKSFKRPGAFQELDDWLCWGGEETTGDIGQPKKNGTFCHLYAMFEDTNIWILVIFIFEDWCWTIRYFFHRRFFQVVLQIAATGGGWPLQLQERLLQLLNTPCEVELELELDESQGDTWGVDGDDSWWLLMVMMVDGWW